MAPVHELFTLGQLITIFCCLAGLLDFTLHKLAFDRATITLYLVALACSFIQFATTSPFQFANDIGGHIGYMTSIVDTHHIPPPLGWQEQQPPLYYVTAALFELAGKSLGGAKLYCGRIASLFFYYGGLLFSGLILRQFVPQKRVYYACLIMVLFWPVATATSVKMNNDIALFFFSCGFVHCLTTWLKTQHLRTLGWAIALAGLGMASKSSGMFMLFMLLMAVTHQWLTKKITLPQLRSRPVVVGLVVMAVCLSINFGRIYYWRAHEGNDIKWLINRDESYVGTLENVTNTPADFLVFKYRAFIDQPFMCFENTCEPAHHFLNVLLKTLMFGDHSYHNNVMELAPILSFMFLIYLGCMGMLIVTDRKKIRSDIPLLALLLTTLSCVFMVMGARILVPVSSQASARYIYVIVVLIAAAYGNILSRLYSEKRSVMLANAGFFMLANMAFFSLIFTLTQWGWPIIFSAVHIYHPSISK